MLTLQAREQHIRRSKATSNICSNQNACALRSLIYLSLMGPQGLQDVAENSMEMAHYAARTLTAGIEGAELLNDASFGNEVALTLPVSADLVVQRCLAKHKVVPGYPVGRTYPGMDKVLLVACTEKNTVGQVGILLDAMQDVIADIRQEEALRG